MRQAAKRRERKTNIMVKQPYAICDLESFENAVKKTEQLPEVASMIDKLAKRGIIHKNVLRT